jgi:uroporphyrinogen decarboxylase
MAEMNRWERIGATIEGAPTDRVPYSLWRHFYDRETTAEDLAAVMLDWQRRHEFDLLKVNPRAQYHAEAWGARYHYSGQPHIKPQVVQVPVQAPEDWQKLDVVAPTDGPLGEQLRALQLIGRGLGGQTPFVETVFSPLGVAGYLAGDDATVIEHLRRHPRLLHQGLGVITETLIGFVHEVLNAGASGIFFATTHWATYNALTDEEYDEFGRPYDLQVLRAADEARVNVLHVCQERNMLLRLLDYPAPILNWAAVSPTNPTLGEIAERVDGKAVMGGISNDALTASDPRRALEEAARALKDTAGRRWIMAGNCSIPTQSRDEVITALRAWLGA